MFGPRPIGVLVCDSYHATLVGIARILIENGMQVLGTTATVRECLACATDHDPAVYVVGINHGDPPGHRLVRELRSQHSDAAIVAYGIYTNPRTISLIYESGASAYVVKSSHPDVLIEAIRSVEAGAQYWDPGIAEEVAMFYTSGAHLNRPKDRLTPSELKLFTLLGKGTSLVDAAKQLGIGERSAGNQVVTICKKLGIDRFEFTQVAKEYDIL